MHFYTCKSTIDLFTNNYSYDINKHLTTTKTKTQKQKRQRLLDYQGWWGKCQRWDDNQEGDPPLLIGFFFFFFFAFAFALELVRESERERERERVSAMTTWEIQQQKKWVLSCVGNSVADSDYKPKRWLREWVEYSGLSICNSYPAHPSTQDFVFFFFFLVQIK